MAKHTPGPWHWTGNSIVGGCRKRKTAIAQMEYTAAFWCGEAVKAPRKQDEANAHLIAAAPDLLAALLAIIDARNRHSEFVHFEVLRAIDTARDAVLLATEGREPHA